MNLSSILGFILAGVVIWTCVIAGSPNPRMLLDVKAFFLVTGGSIAAGLVIFPLPAMLDLGKVILYGVILKRLPDRRQLVKEIVSAASLHPSEYTMLPACPASHPFLSEGFRLIAENRLSPTELGDVLQRRSQHFKQTYMGDAKMLATLAKFPSAFGMLGSTVGLIDMMAELGGEKGQEGIGPAMAMAMVATFWGLVMTYMILMPLSDYTARLAAEDNIIRQLIVDGLVMIKQGKDPQIVLDKLNGFLALADRLVLRRGSRERRASWEEISQEIDNLRKGA
jgi:chemotaxis protein MotA